MNDVEITTDLTKNILKRKAEPIVLILVHYYKEFKIQDIADFVGDRCELIIKIKEVDAVALIYNSKKKFIPNFKNILTTFQNYFKCSSVTRL